MPRTVVGLFNSTSEAQRATEQLLAAGFMPGSLRLATPDTLRAQHLPAPVLDAPTDSLENGVVRFFTNLFSGNENDAAQAHAAATHADSAVLTAQAATEAEAEHARRLLDAAGAVDVYKQAAGSPTAAATRPNDTVDLEGRLSRVRDADDLDANGLTTH